MALVYAARDIGVPPGAEDTGAVPVFGLTRAEVGRREGEAALRVVDRPGIVEEEGTLGLVETPVLAAEYRGRRT